MTDGNKKKDLQRLRELMVHAQARSGWNDEWDAELNVLACRFVPDLLCVVDALASKQVTFVPLSSYSRLCGLCESTIRRGHYDEHAANCAWVLARKLTEF